MNRAAIDFAEGAARDYTLGGEAFVRSGKINAAATDKGHRHNEAYARHLGELDEPHRMLNATEMKALAGTSYYRGGLYTPGTAMIQPALFVRGLASGLASQGVRIWENSPVTVLERTGASWVAQTPRGSIAAPKVILAVNGHAESFGSFRRRLVHVFTYAPMTRARTPGEVAALGGKALWAARPPIRWEPPCGASPGPADIASSSATASPTIRRCG